MDEITFITSNPHKVDELREAFIGLDIKINHVKQQYSEPQADTIKQVVLSSLADLATTLNNPFLIEDSGLSIDALSGFPGPYSSYVFRKIGWVGVLRLMRGITNRMANFTSIFAYWDGNSILTFEGVVEGNISEEGKGSMGFGFDPIFIPNSEHNPNGQTYAELPLLTKNKVSHRGKSLMKLVDFVKNNS